MAQPFDASKLTCDLKQMLKLSQTPAQSDTSHTQANSTTDSRSQYSENKHPNMKKAQIDPQSSAPGSSGNHKNLSPASDLHSVRKKRQRAEKHPRKVQGKSPSVTPCDKSPRQSDIESSKLNPVESNLPCGKNSSVIVLPSRNRNMGNSDSSMSRTKQGPSVLNQTTESNDNSDASVLKNQYDDLSRELQIRMDENKMFFLKKRNMRFPNAKYYCRYCDYHMDTIEICEKHMEETKHRHKKEVGSMDSTLRRLPPPTVDHIEAITEAIDLMYEEYGIKPKDRDVRRDIVQRLEEAIQKDIPDVRLYMYGSSSTCMGLKTSDINVNLTSAVKDKKLTSLLKELYTLLKDRTDTGFNNVHSDFSAAVPVLSMTDNEMGYKLTIAIHVYSSLCTSELLSIYSDFDERTIKLTIAFRYWAYICGVDRHSIGFIPPIALNIMVIFFLQAVKPSVLPIVAAPGLSGEDTGDFAKDKPVFQLKRNKVMSRKAELNNDMSVGELWVLLLRFYTIELDIPDVVISIRTSSPISRRHKPWNSRKLAVEEPYMMKNLTRMLTRSYEYWQYTIRKAFHYFGLPRGPGGISFLPEYNFPDVEESSVPQVEKPTDKENVANQEKENDTENGLNDSAHESLPPPACDTVDPKTDGALNSSSLKETHDSSEPDNNSLIENSETSTNTLTAETSNSSHPGSSCTRSSDKSSSSIDVATDVDIETKDSDSIQSFVLKYVNSIVENALDLVSKEASSSSSQLQSSSSPLSHITDPKQKDADTVAVEDSKLGEKTDAIKLPILTQKDNRCLFEFKKEYFSNKREPEIICIICEKEGHHKNECPEDVLPEVLPIQGFTEHHQKVLEETLNKMPSEVGLSDVSFKERQMFLKCLEEFIQVGFPGARLQLFGSSCNGFGFDRSDMDICMTLLKRRPNIDKVYAVERLANILVVHKDLKNVQAIPTAKVPIVKFTIKNIELDGDISLYNTLAQENTRLLYSYGKIDPRVQILGYTIKMFAQVCDIGDASRGSLSSYGYILMMLYYLQQVQPAVIPVLQELHTYKTKPKKIVEGCDAWFMDDLNRLPKMWPEMGQNKMSVAELWLGFLRFYVEEFNYRELVISIKQKEPLTRFDKLWNGFCLAIEDPFDLSHNLGSGLTRTMNNFILKTFINGRMLYGSPIDDNMELFNKYQTPSDYFFDTELLSEARPPTLRGCRHCGKIGHLIRHCPLKKEKDDEQQQKRSTQEKQMQSQNHQPQNMSFQNQMLQRNPNHRDHQQRQQYPQYQRQQDHHQQQQRYQHSSTYSRSTPENRGHYSPKQDRHSVQRQQHRQQQQNKSYPFQQQKQQEGQQLQKRPERELFGGDRLQGSEPQKDNRPPGTSGQGHHYNVELASPPVCVPPVVCSRPHTFPLSQTCDQAPQSAILSSGTSHIYNRPFIEVPKPNSFSGQYLQLSPFGANMNMGNSPFIRPTTISPAMNQRQPMQDLRYIPPPQYPPSLRPPRARGIVNNNQFPMYGINPPPGLVPPFHYNFNNNNNNPPNSGGSSNNNSNTNANNMRGDSMAALPPHNYMNRSAGQGHGNTGGTPALLPHPGASPANMHGMNPVVQNLFASTQGKVLDARMMHNNAMKKH